ncbi:hypothetical protein BS78_09G184700 [Paspalum vaginatum]|nr:hypothetical protein BS78_09G184700 [Paspalum vaginatum]
MGRRRFRLGDMMPNTWFYKLRDMRRARGHPPVVASGGGAASAMLPSSSSPPPPRGTRPAARTASPRRASASLPHRTSYYYPTRDRELQPAPQPRPAAATEEDRELLPQPESLPPTCSSRRRSVRAGRGPEAVAEPHGRRRRDMYVGRGGGGEEEAVEEVRRAAAVTGPSEDALGGKLIASETDIVIDLRAEGTAERVLRPIATRPARKEEAIRYGYEPEEDRYVYVDLADTTPRASSASEQGGKGQHHPRRSSVSAGRRLRTRANSPRLASSTSRSRRKSKPTTPAASPRKTPLAPPLAESFAVVKASADPRRDFRESMEEMIAEKGIRGAADLEDLLACYLALNAAEHHDLIVEVFEQIWASLAGANGP